MCFCRRSTGNAGVEEKQTTIETGRRRNGIVMVLRMRAICGMWYVDLRVKRRYRTESK
jgi:hypothetical protein